MSVTKKEIFNAEDAEDERRKDGIIAVSKWMRPAFRVHAESVSGAAA